MSEIIKAVEQLVTPLLEKEKVELVDLTYQKGPDGWVLCFFIDKQGGVTLDDCTHWSDQFGNALDTVDVIPHSYSLEVSSPGIYRPLKKVQDFERFRGERVLIRLYAPINGQKHFLGILMGVQGDAVRVLLDDKQEVSFSMNQIAKSNLEPALDI